MRRSPFAALAAAAAVLASAGTAAAGAPTRNTFDFDFPDQCAFSLHIHGDSMTVSSPGGFHEHTTYTISNPQNGRTLTQIAVQRYAAVLEPDGSLTSYVTGVVRITLPGWGAAFLDVGRVAFYRDANGVFVGRDATGRHDDANAYIAAVCGYLADQSP